MEHEDQYIEDDRELTFVTIKRRPCTYSELIENYSEMIYDLRKSKNFKAEIMAAIEMLVSEIGDMVEEDLLFSMIKRSADMLNAKHQVYDD